MNKIVEYKEKKSKKKVVAAVLLAAVIAVAALAIFFGIKWQIEAAYRENFDKSAMEVGGYTVTYDVYRYFYLNYRDEMEASFTDADGKVNVSALDRKIREAVEGAVKGLYGVVSLAADYGISLGDSDVRSAAAEYVKAVEDYYEKPKDYKKDLEENYITEDVFMLLMGVDCLEDKLFSMLVSDGGKIEDNDEKLTAILMGDDFVRAKQIFIENDKGEDVENNRKIAEEALEKYLSGEDLATLIGRYSEDISMPADGYYFTHLEMIEEFETAAFALGDGEVSGVVESEDGFHIIVRLPKDEKYIQDNFSELKSQYQSSAFYKMIDARAEALRATESEFVRGLSYEEIH